MPAQTWTFVGCLALGDSNILHLYTKCTTVLVAAKRTTPTPARDTGRPRAKLVYVLPPTDHLHVDMCIYVHMGFGRGWHPVFLKHAVCDFQAEQTFHLDLNES